MKQSIADLVNAAPLMTDDSYASLADLFRRHEVLHSFFAQILDDAMRDAVSIKEFRPETPEGLGQTLRMQGAVLGRQSVVNATVAKMDEVSDNETKTPNRKIRTRVVAKKAAPKKSKR